MTDVATPGAVVTPPPGAKEVGGSLAPMYKWERIGQQLTGRFVNMKVFRNGHLAKIVTDDGEVVTFSAPTMLADRLELCVQGDRLTIALVGETPSTRGNPVKQFKVWKH